MAQFDVYQNLNADTNKIIPYFLDIQSDFLKVLTTRVVIPLMLGSEVSKPIKNLNHTFKIKNTTVVMLTSELAGIPVNRLGAKIASLANYRNDIISALDFLITGI